MHWLFPLFLILFLPDLSYAWGPLTHAYLAQQILNLQNLIPLSLVSLLLNHREHFIYGNIIPDTIIGKKYLPQEKNPHSWKTGLTLLNEAKSEEEKAFAYGYLSHLAADAILHHEIRQLNPIQHVFFELKADRIVDRVYWLQIMTISRSVKKLSDRFFEQNLKSPIPSLKTSKKIYKSLIFLSAFNTGERRNPELFRPFHIKSLTAILEILKEGEEAQIIKLPPNR